MLFAFFATLAGTIWLVQTTPKGFFPQEDIGQLSVSTEARQDISFGAMKTLQAQVAEVFRKSPHVAHVASSVGGSGGAASALNSGRLFVELKPKDERPAIGKVLGDLRRELAQVPGITAFMTPVQNLNIGARSSKSQYQLVVQGLDQTLMNEWAVKLADAMGQDRAHFIDVTTDLQNSASEATLAIDRDKANQLRIGADVLRSTLYSGFGVRQVSTIYTAGDSYQVIVEFDPRHGWSPDRLDQVRIRAGNGQMVPLGAFARVERTVGQLTVNQLGQIPAVTISYNLPPGVALGDSVAQIDAIKTTLGFPATLTTTLAGTAKTFQDSLANQGFLIAGAILTIYIVLGILYESFIHPLTILTGLPSAAIGALGALRLFDLDLSVIAMIRAADADRHRQEERDHDDRRRARAATRGCSGAGGDPPGLRDAVQADPDDDARRRDGHAADRAGGRRQRGTAPAAGHRGGRRPADQPGADALHHAGAVPVHGPDRPRRDAAVQPPPHRDAGAGRPGGMTADRRSPRSAFGSRLRAPRRSKSRIAEARAIRYPASTVSARSSAG